MNRTWVLLRGLMRETRHWGEFVPQLQKAFPNDQTITLDWPGNGRLHQMKSLCSIHEMVGYLRTELIQKGYVGPYHVIAVSLGAMVAIEWAQHHPQDIAHCTLINTSVRPHNPFYQRLRPHNYPRLIGLLWANAYQQEKTILAITSQNLDLSRTEQWTKYQREYPISKLNILRQLWAAMHFIAPHEQPNAPVLLLSSNNDQLVNNQCSRTLAHKWKLEHHAHPTAGHDLPLDEAAWLIQRIQQTL